MTWESSREATTTRTASAMDSSGAEMGSLELRSQRRWRLWLVSQGMNLEGAIVGYYTDSTHAFRAFLRAPDGKFTTWVGPDACTGNGSEGCYGSAAFNINVLGIIVGGYTAQEAATLFTAASCVTARASWNLSMLLALAPRTTSARVVLVVPKV